MLNSLQTVAPTTIVKSITSRGGSLNFEPEDDLCNEILLRQRDQKSENAIEDCPKGYPRLAAFLDIDENFMLYRRFGFLQARILLYKQDELRRLEHTLDRLDKVDEVTRPDMLLSREKDDADDDFRMKLIHQIDEKFRDYAQLLIVARDLAAFSRPPTRDYLNIRKYFDEQAPLCNVESYIYHREDIVTLKPGREHSWLDSIVESILRRLSGRIVRVVYIHNSCVRLLQRERVELLVSLIITVIIVAILIIPIYLLFYLTVGTQTNHSMAIIISVLLIFTLLFSGVLSLFTRAKRHEILAAAAAYCAVLVVFIGNVGKLNT
ncbi:hypothetical protein LOCC1_G005188 [Lachnellula occidentalis]|uniref:DUF6594 domain-containing protein n=1 Tax=Lachnellula occidentalis TaxID=215460 RepID=A0A8H8RZ52_9HELO|nr:hypothetical protein LOCC1_G005188 [Lachnellula occidentalis]